MYPTLPLGSLSLPTGPILTVLAVMLALDVAGRFGRRLRIHPDDIWNVGLIALATGLIVARLWNVFQFWDIYRSELLLIVSLRPSGFELLPGIFAALIGGYLYMLRRALDPVRVGAALALGAVAGSIILSVAGHATGSVLGTQSDLPWALPYFGETRHPVGLYRALGAALLTMALWIRADLQRPGRTILLAVLGYSLVRLVSDAYLADAALVADFRRSQLIALGAAILATIQLARTASSTRETGSQSPAGGSRTAVSTHESITTDSQ